jgi:hypothetical protein
MELDELREKQNVGLIVDPSAQQSSIRSDGSTIRPTE